MKWDTILNYLIMHEKEEKALELINKMEIESINKVNKYEMTALIYACNKKMGSVALKLLEREEIHDFLGACRRIEHVSHVQSLCHVNQVNKSGNTALIWACINKMESVALKLLEREEININHVNEMGQTALNWACYAEMESVINKIKEVIFIKKNEITLYNI